ncbi:hypothetical protein [Mycolicibacterium porcinum]|uniref:Uncharacterized protein n=1 Tax=Mycolicibacterium porcinum TaxID=39693 RepID=A0ABV3VBY2_9MYCO
MGDYAQALVDIDVSDEAAPQLKQRLLRWLIEKRVVVEQVSDCVLGSKGGYAPGENYGYALWGHAGAYRAEPPGSGPMASVSTSTGLCTGVVIWSGCSALSVGFAR